MGMLLKSSAVRYVPELNNKINDICSSGRASVLNSIKFYENAAIKLYIQLEAACHMCVPKKKSKTNPKGSRHLPY